MFRYSIRELVLLMSLVAVLAAWGADRARLAGELAQHHEEENALRRKEYGLREEIFERTGEVLMHVGP